MKENDQQELLLKHIRQSSAFSPDVVKRMHDSHWLVFGGSGFVGRWLTLFGQEFSIRNQSPTMVTIVSRNPQRASAQLRSFLPRQYLVPKIISMQEFMYDAEVFNSLENVDTIFHAATPTNRHDKSILDLPSLTSVILEKCDRLDTPKFIHLSSGGVYPRDRFLSQLISEGTKRVAVNQAVNAYQKVKVTLEQMVEVATEAGRIRGANPRLFAFAGPGFPLDAPFAFSDFLRSALMKRPIEIRGNPFTRRSYMHPLNMTEWLVSLVDQIDQIGLDPVHIGSHIPISMFDLATKISQEFGGVEVRSVEGGAQNEEWYVPEVLKMRSLGCNLNLSSIETILESWVDFLAPQHSIWD
jgi:nucleoside-diphosphate-sugar epimerase